MIPLQIKSAADLIQWMHCNGYSQRSLARENLVSREMLGQYCRGEAVVPRWFLLALNGLNCLNKHK